MPEWIRPDGCEGGACVEYRTEAGYVYVRDNTGGMVMFTVAEWDTFVAGLVANERKMVLALHAENARLKGLVGDETFEAETWEGCDRAEAIRQALSFQAFGLKWSAEHDRRRDERDEARQERDKLREDLAAETARAESLAAENARLRQDVDRYKGWLATANRELNEATAERDRQHRMLLDANMDITKLVAEAAVLRHRDRRTQAVVEAAEVLVLAWLKDDVADSTPLRTAVVRFWEAMQTAPKSTLPAEQPQPVAQPTDGPEPQGEAQRHDEAIPRAIVHDWMAHLGYEPDEILTAEAEPDHSPCGYRPDPGQICRDEEGRDLHPAHTELAEAADLVMFVLDSPHLNRPVEQAPEQGSGVVWHHPCGKTAITSPGVAAPMECEDCDLPGGWVTYSNSTGSLPPIKPGSYMKVHWGEPRVWNAGDLEPEGVEEVRSVRRNRIWTKNGDGKWSGERLTRSWEWAAVVQVEGPLTEVLPEPTPATGGFYPDTPIRVPDNTRIVDLDGNTVGVYRRPTEPLTPVAFCTCGHCRVAREVYANANPTEPDGAVPEAGRAGEAQTMTDEQVAEFMKTEDDATYAKMRAHDRGECDHCSGQLPMWECDLLQRPPKPLTPTPVNPEFEPRGPVVDQDRTEGLDAAIEAAAAHQPRTIVLDHWWCDCGAQGPGDFWTDHRLVVQVRAASPLIERAALNAAADELEAEAGRVRAIRPGESGYNDAVSVGLDASARILRDRATRTETP